MKIVFSKRCLEYQFPGHPESPQRVENVYTFLKENFADAKLGFIEPEPAREGDVLLVHSKSLVEKVKRGEFLDSDTPNSGKMFDYALLSCGAAIHAQALALQGEPSFSLMRPPGHHATRDLSGGFCYFNNIAVAVRKALDTVRKVAVIDIDCHHGNGTQDIFWGNERILYVSLHQSPLYPGTGVTSTKNCFNFPLSPGTNGEQYLTVFKNVINEVKKFSPQLIAVSAGFDTYKNDPLTNLKLEKHTYAEISDLIVSLRKPVFSVLEGGYSLDIAECVEQYLMGWK